MSKYTNYIDYLGFHYRLIFICSPRKDGRYHVRFALEIKLTNRHSYWEKINLLAHFKDIWKDYFKTQDIDLHRSGNGIHSISAYPKKLIETLLNVGFEAYSATRYIYSGQEMLKLNQVFAEILKSDLSSIEKVTGVDSFGT